MWALADIRTAYIWTTGYGCALQDFVVSARFPSADCKIRYSDMSTTVVLDHDFRALIMPAAKARVQVELCVLNISGESE